MTATSKPVEKPPETLNAALAALQADLPVVVKGNTAQVVAKSGARFSYTYADLADVATTVYPLLARQGLSFVARPMFGECGYVLHGELRHVSGEAVVGDFPLPDTRDPQQLGSALTYGRRYLLGCLSGVVTDSDDDGGAAHAAEQSRGSSRAPRPSDQSPSDAPPGEPLDVDDLVEDYWQQIKAADAPAKLAEVGSRIAGDRRLPRDKSAGLKQRYDIRMQELTAEPDESGGEAA